jgi:hypothetical protein
MSDEREVGVDSKMPAGVYYVGDPCYVLSERFGYSWDDVLKKTDYFESSWSGVYEYDGVKMFVSSTAYGDGTYRDSEGRSYDVDAGLLCCILLDTLTEEAQDGAHRIDGVNGNIVEFPRDFEPEEVDKNGTIDFGPFTIDTGDEQEEDDYWY